MQNKTFKTAHTAFSKANQLNPEYFLPLLGRGIAAQKLERYEQADQDLSASLKLLPTQSGTYYLAETKLALGQRDTAIRYFRQAAQGGGQLGEYAKAYLAELVPPEPATQQQ